MGGQVNLLGPMKKLRGYSEVPGRLRGVTRWPRIEGDSLSRNEIGTDGATVVINQNQAKNVKGEIAELDGWSSLGRGVKNGGLYFDASPIWEDDISCRHWTLVYSSARSVCYGKGRKIGHQRQQSLFFIGQRCQARCEFTKQCRQI